LAPAWMRPSCCWRNYVLLASVVLRQESKKIIELIDIPAKAGTKGKRRAAAPCSDQGQALGPCFRGGDGKVLHCSSHPGQTLIPFYPTSTVASMLRRGGFRLRGSPHPAVDRDRPAASR
jgi:hypothetical protein